MIMLTIITSLCLVICRDFLWLNMDNWNGIMRME